MYDSLVIDLIFSEQGVPTPEDVIDALGGPRAVQGRQLLDPDTADPRIEMELCPTVPFRRRGERRLLLFNTSVAPLRKDPANDPVVPIDLRGEKELLLLLVERFSARLGRIFAFGSWGDAVLAARSARDLRGFALITWALDPQMDVEGRRRASRLNKTELEAKLAAYDKRLEELDEQQILQSIGPARFERRGDLLVLDVLEPDGTWDLRHSIEMETALAAVDRFSIIPGAPQSTPQSSHRPTQTSPSAPGAAPDTAGATNAGDHDLPPLAVHELNGKVVLVFPAERWSLDTAAAIGKGSWDQVLQRSDRISGSMRDRIHSEGAGFVAPLEFFSEVFVDGKPLARPVFDKIATAAETGARTAEAHCPRFGPVVLIADKAAGRFITSELEAGARVLSLLGALRSD